MSHTLPDFQTVCEIFDKVFRISRMLHTQSASSSCYKWQLKEACLFEDDTSFTSEFPVFHILLLHWEWFRGWLIANPYTYYYTVNLGEKKKGKKVISFFIWKKEKRRYLMMSCSRTWVSWVLMRRERKDPRKGDESLFQIHKWMCNQNKI